MGLVQNKKRSNVFLDKILIGVKDSSNIRCSILGLFFMCLIQMYIVIDGVVSCKSQTGIV